jgi:myo-inositol-1(or 4)-monophosphatase
VHSLQADLELLTSAARDAGALALTFFRNSPNAWSKTGGSPVTDADVAVDEYLRVKLLAERPHYGWLSEETADDPARLSRETIFAVDPIDGTRGFIEGDDRWCVSLALVRRGRPVAAALFAAARAELYSAAEGGGAFLGATRLAVTDRLALAGARITGPRGWLKTAAIVAAGAELQPHIPSLAYRLTSVSAGRVDGAFASPGANDWDLAACDLLVHEAGGRLTGLDGAALRYNQEVPRHGALAAANIALQPILLARVAEAGQEIARRRG